MKHTYTIHTLSVHPFMQKSEKTKLIFSSGLYYVYYLEFTVYNLNPDIIKNTTQKHSTLFRIHCL